MSITETIDARIEKLHKIRKIYLSRNEIGFANQMWARLEELKELKKKFTDKEGEWLI